MSYVCSVGDPSPHALADQMLAGSAPDQRCVRHGRPGPDVQAPALPPGLVPLRALPAPGAARRGS